MDPEQVVRDETGTMACRQCGFTYNLSPPELVSQTQIGLDAVERAIEEVPLDRLDRQPQPDVWSVNAYVAHLADASEVILQRVRMIAERDKPTLPYHEQDQAAEEGGYDRIPTPVSLARLQQTTGEFLGYVAAFPETAWQRRGVHARAGTVSLSEIAHDMPHELLHHAEDIHQVGAAS